MNFQEIARGFQQLWEEKPGALVLLGVGLAAFLFLVVDTWRYRRYRKRPR